MTIDSAIRVVVRDQLRQVVREEINAALASVREEAPREDGYVSVSKAAAFASVHPNSIRLWVRQGRLPGHRAGRELRIRLSELRRFLAGHDNAKDPAPNPSDLAAKILASI